MGFSLGSVLDTVVGVGSLGLIDTDFAGEGAIDAAEEAAKIQAEAGQLSIEERLAAAARAQEFLSPFAEVGQRGIDASGFLLDPQAQFDFLQNNPLFNLALENANKGTQQRASAGRRLSFGDTLQELSNNVLLSASPLIDRRRQDIFNLLNLGSGTSRAQANVELGVGSDVGGLLTDIGAAEAGGVVGAANAETQAFQNILQLGAQAAGAVAGAGGFPSFGGSTPPPPSINFGSNSPFGPNAFAGGVTPNFNFGP